MTTMLVSALLGLSLSGTTVQPKIVAASMFKNGYVVVQREIPTPSAGDYYFDTAPQAALGTLWFLGSEGTVVNTVETTTQSSEETSNASSLNQILNLNVGHTVTLTVHGPLDKVETLTGKILVVTGTLLILQSDKTQTIDTATVLAVSAPNGELVYSSTSKMSKRVLHLAVSGKPGHVIMMSLERGMTWVPGYAIDLMDGKKLSITVKATVMNDLEDLKGADARFVTGFPNVPFSHYFEPLTSGTSLDTFISMIGGAQVGGQLNGGMVGQNGGFTNRAGELRGLNNQNSGRVTGTADGFEDLMPTPVAGERLEDLFFYHQPALTLPKGERAYYTLLHSEVPYSDVYTWDVADTSSRVRYANDQGNSVEIPEIWHAIQFKNNTEHPFTTAAATTFRGNQLIGQDMLTYVPAGGEAEVKLTRALDLSASSAEEETQRERGVIKRQNGTPVMDLVTVKGTIQVLNLKSEPVTLRIRRNVVGKFIEAEGTPTVVATSPNLRELNATTKMTWKPTITGHGKLLLHYTYSAFVGSTVGND